MKLKQSDFTGHLTKILVISYWRHQTASQGHHTKLSDMIDNSFKLISSWHLWHIFCVAGHNETFGELNHPNKQKCNHWHRSRSRTAARDKHDQGDCCFALVMNSNQVMRLYTGDEVQSISKIFNGKAILRNATHLQSWNLHAISFTGEKRCEERYQLLEKNAKQVGKTEWKKNKK